MKHFKRLLAVKWTVVTVDMVSKTIGKAADVDGIEAQHLMILSWPVQSQMYYYASRPWRGWLTIVLQCYDTVGWVIWPVKLFPKWPIMCRVGRWRRCCFTCWIFAQSAVNGVYVTPNLLPIWWTGQSRCPVPEMGCFTDITGTNTYSWTLADLRGGIILNECYNT